MSFMTGSFRRLINRVRRRKRRHTGILIRLPYCCVCGSIECLSQHHESPLVKGGNVSITICGECKMKRHGRSKEKAEIIRKIQDEIYRIVDFV